MSEEVRLALSLRAALPVLAFGFSAALCWFHWMAAVPWVEIPLEGKLRTYVWTPRELATVLVTAAVPCVIVVCLPSSVALYVVSAVDIVYLAGLASFLPLDRCQGGIWQVPSIIGYCPRGAENPLAVRQRLLFATAVCTWSGVGLAGGVPEVIGSAAEPCLGLWPTWVLVFGFVILSVVGFTTDQLPISDVLHCGALGVFLVAVAGTLGASAACGGPPALQAYQAASCLLVIVFAVAMVTWIRSRGRGSQWHYRFFVGLEWAMIVALLAYPAVAGAATSSRAQRGGGGGARGGILVLLAWRPVGCRSGRGAPEVGKAKCPGVWSGSCLRALAVDTVA
eukprot:CAMPEP_0204493896 /NCGR_PEP_ID=MMETSP0471-20130131/83113_1 /ASSEMBLY_ACC=CAM_ASM_000602 /TAXON_ID=2969 /ORGANISM="Oxyrrhis marina" /LENGTH=336 /DNA_ID=CAMNT_0051498061 /DNA_START=14 /DNA_END=1021 /DNA_ORIENTATION=-